MHKRRVRERADQDRRIIHWQWWHYFFEISEDDNPVLEDMFNANVAEDIETGCATGVQISNEQIFKHLLPRNWRENGYYAYQGGLTTSPCTDDVNWVILNQKAKISERQLARLRMLRNKDEEEIHQ